MFVQVMGRAGRVGLPHNTVAEMLAPFFRVAGINNFKFEDEVYWFPYEVVVWLALSENNALAQISLIRANLL